MSFGVPAGIRTLRVVPFAGFILLASNLGLHRAIVLALRDGDIIGDLDIPFTDNLTPVFQARIFRGLKDAPFHAN